MGGFDVWMIFEGWFGPELWVKVQGEHDLMNCMTCALNTTWLQGVSNTLATLLSLACGQTERGSTRRDMLGPCAQRRVNRQGVVLTDQSLHGRQNLSLSLSVCLSVTHTLFSLYSLSLSLSLSLSRARALCLIKDNRHRTTRGERWGPFSQGAVSV
jgi:hypothetical protein